MHSAILNSRMPGSCSAPRRAPACLALAAIACLMLAACSPGADYPPLFPGVHDIPPPRTDTPLDANQVQQATEDLITARDRLSAEAQSSQNKSAAKPPAAAAPKKQPVSLTPTAANPPPKPADAGQSADAETK